MSKAEAKRFDAPDEVRPFTGHGHVDLVHLGTGDVGMTTVGRVAGRQLPTLSIRFPVRYQANSTTRQTQSTQVAFRKRLEDR